MNDVTSKAELIQTCCLAYQYILDTAVEGQQGTRLTHAQCADLGRRLSDIWQATPDDTGDAMPSPAAKRVGAVSCKWLANRAERIVDELTSMTSSDPNDDTKPADRIAFMRKTSDGEVNLGGSNHNHMVAELTDQLSWMLGSLGISVTKD